MNLRMVSMRDLLISLTVMAIGASGYGQQQNQTPATAVIKGSAHPELIPDTTADRLYIMTVSGMPPATEQAELSSAGLSMPDIMSCVSIFEQFHTQWIQIRNAYNEATFARVPSAEERDAFLKKRDSLVTATLNLLRTNLTQPGEKALVNHIIHEKMHMTISASSAH